MLASEGQPISGTRCRLLWYCFNPFSVSCSHVGDVDYGEQWSPVDLSPFLVPPLGGAPTLLIAGKILSDEDAAWVFSELLLNVGRGAATLGQLRKYPGDPWNRIKVETDSALDSRPGPGAGEASPPEQRLNQIEAVEFAQLQLQANNAQEEFKAFFMAWKGAIEFSGLRPTLSGDDFIKGPLSAFAITANIPLTKRR